ncbi:MAG: hypothetical protein AB8F94_26225 [Saprospiraceae bacterium]
MKNNKTDSDILDDNYFPEEKQSSIKINEAIIFFKIIGFTILFSSLFIAILFFITFFLYPSPPPSDPDFNPKKDSIIILFLSYAPFICLLYVLNEDKVFRKDTWKIGVLIYSSFISLIVSFVMYFLLTFDGYG